MDYDDMDWQRANYPTEELARAFADGLTYGDEPQYAVDAIEKCRYGDGWDVVFTFAEDEADPAEAAGRAHGPEDHVTP